MENKWNKFKNNKIAVHCNTKEESVLFIKKCREQNINTENYKYEWNQWKEYKENTCYDYDKKNKDLDFCDIETYKENDYIIIEFKDFIGMEKNKNMPYKIYEVLKLIEEDTTLEFQNEHGEIMKYKNGCVRCFKSNKNLELYGFSIADKWELIKQPVTFEEVLNSNKRCKVKHDLIKERFNVDGCSSYETSYETLDVLISFLSNSLDDKDLKEVIKNGKWYLED